MVNGKKGIDLFWDHKTKDWVPKRLQLEKVPMKYRCPTCGTILVQPKDREFADQLPQSWNMDLIGGVCQRCWLDGHGTHGKTGKMFREGLSEQEVELMRLK